MPRTVQVAHGSEDVLSLPSCCELMRNGFHCDVIREAGSGRRLDDCVPERCVQWNQALGQGHPSGEVKCGPHGRRDPQSANVDDVVIGDTAFVDEEVTLPVGVRVASVY